MIEEVIWPWNKPRMLDRHYLSRLAELIEIEVACKTDDELKDAVFEKIEAIVEICRDNGISINNDVVLTEEDYFELRNNLPNKPDIPDEVDREYAACMREYVF